MPVLICSECGAENDLTAETCRECGASLLSVIPSTPQPLESSGQDDLTALSQNEHDLPDLLSALKQEDDLQPEEEGGKSHLEPAEESPHAGVDFNVDGEKIPDWLKRIRERASNEKDSAGEVTQKITAARESLEGGKGAVKHDNYESWLQRLRDQGIEKGEGKSPGALPEDLNAGEGDTDWLSKVKKAQGRHLEADPDDNSSASEREGDSLLQWLVELEDRGEKPKPILETEEELQQRVNQDTLPARVFPQKSDPQATRQINKDELHFESPALEISHEEQTQADQLTAAIVDERASRPVRKPGRRSFAWLVRLVLGLLLIVGLSFSLFTGGNAVLPEGLLQPHNEDLMRWAEELPAGASLLLVMDYSPGFTGEVSLVAAPILGAVISEDTAVAVISSSASGPLLAENLLGQLVTDGQVTDLGYVLVSAYGAYGLASRYESEWNGLTLPASGETLLPGGVDGILILSDSYEGARAWIEQLSALLPDTPLHLLVTAQAGPMLAPYLESGQVSGMISGISEAAGVEKSLTEGEAVSRRWQAYQTGVLMLIVALVVGVIFNIDSKAAAGLRGEE